MPSSGEETAGGIKRDERQAAAATSQPLPGQATGYSRHSRQGDLAGARRRGACTGG